jgi:hypothetical protein
MVADNNKRMVHYLAGKYEGRLGHLYSPGSARPPVEWLPYALDNGRFVCWSHGEEWDESAYLKLLETHGAGARWCLVPDVVADRGATLRHWDEWVPKMHGLTLAFALQDGMTASDVPSEAAVVFVGGTTAWKRRTLYHWRQNQERVHVGRINTEKWLWECHRAGCESCDGTGWFRGDQVQLRGLLRYLDRSSRGVGPAQGCLFEASSDGSNSGGEARTRVPAANSRQQMQPRNRSDAGPAMAASGADQKRT